MGRILATFATILILLLAAAFALPAFVDWNSYRSTIEDMASDVLGRKVSIVGNIGIELLPEPHLRANNIAAGNGRSDAVLLSAAAADVSLSLESLFSGRLDASQLKLVRPVLILDFSKRFTRPGEAYTLAAGLSSVEIEDGRVSVFSRHGGSGEALSLTGLNGTASASRSGNALRFNGRMLKDGRSLEVKLLVSQQERGVKLEGVATDPASKLNVHADGFLSARPNPVFEGAIAVNMPQAPDEADRLPFDLQAKSAARVGLSDAKLSNLELTLDSQGRSQVLTGTATIAYHAGAANFSLKALSLDAGALLGGSSLLAPASAPEDWSGLAAAVDRLLWLSPGYMVKLGLEAGQVQLRGELIEAVKLHGKRSKGRWLFDEAVATLPGESTLRLAGTVSKQGRESQLTASVAVEGRNLGRLTRWLMPVAAGGGRLPLGAYSIKGALTLSPEVYAFEGITGKLDGTPFTAGLHLDKVPAQSLQVSLSGDHFDLTRFESGDSEAMLSADGLKNLWQAGLARLTAALGAGEGLDTAAIDISAGSIKMAGSDARNVALHLKYGDGLITVSKLSAETTRGLTLKAEGSVPLDGAARGRFGGRIEAQSPEAIVQAAVLAGLDTAVAERRAAHLSPAALTVSYSANAAGPASARLSGNLGQVRVEGGAEFKGSLSDWNKTELSAHLKLSEPDGNQFAALFFPKAALPAGAAATVPGILSLKLRGNPKQLRTDALLSSGALQAKAHGSATLKPLSFQGEAAAGSRAPEQFLPSPLLALLGGKPGAHLTVSANFTAGASRIDARELSAETPGNSVTGRLAIEAGGVTHIDADLKARSIELPAVLGYFLSQGQGDTFAAALPSSLTSEPPPPDIWNGRPFALAAFKQTEGTVTLAAKTMKLSENVVVSGASLQATLGKGRLDIGSLTGKMLGGALDADLSLTANGSAVAAQGAFTLSGADLAGIAAPGTPPLVTGLATLSLKASGQGLSPRGLISVLRGDGTIQLAGGRLTKLTPHTLQARADKLLAQSLPLTEDAVTEAVAQAVRSKDFKFDKLAIPVKVAGGILEIRRASFSDGKATVSMEGFIDLNKALVDSTWQMSAGSGRRKEWPPVKVTLAGPLRELGARQRTPAAEDFVRAVLIRKMEGDIDRLEDLNSTPAGAAPAKPGAAAPVRASAGWSTSQQPVPAPRKRSRKKRTKQPSVSAARPAQSRSYEQRMRDALDAIRGTSEH